MTLPDPYAPPAPPDPYAPPTEAYPPQPGASPVVVIPPQWAAPPQGVAPPQIVALPPDGVIPPQQGAQPVAPPVEAGPPAYGALVQPGDPNYPPPVTTTEPEANRPEEPVKPTGDRNGWATAAIIAAAISFSLPAIILGVMGLRRAEQLHGVGRRRSIAGIILGAVWLALGVGAVILGHNDIAGMLGIGGTSATHSVSAGQCIDVDQVGARDSEFTVTTCAQPHDAEVFGVATVRDANGNPTWSFPGDEAVTEQADNWCVTEFASYVGSTPETSDLNLHFIAPNEDSWRAGARSIVCYVVPTDGSQLEAGTVRGSNR